MIPQVSLPSNAYPVDAFPSVIRNAVVEVLAQVQAPDAMVATSFLSATAVACQGHVDVELPFGQIRPVSLSLMTVADSGERKSTVDALSAKPLYDHDEACLSEYRQLLEVYERKAHMWDVGQRGLEKNC